MSKYLIPVCDNEEPPYIISTSAHSIEEAETRIMNKLVNKWDLDIPADWEDFIDLAIDAGYSIGVISDLEEF